MAQKPWYETMSGADLDDALEAIVKRSDPDDMSSKHDLIAKALKDSKRLKLAIETAIAHIVARGPDHVSCGVMETAVLMFVVSCELAEHLSKSKPAEIEELNRLFKLEGDANEC